MAAALGGIHGHFSKNLMKLDAYLRPGIANGCRQSSFFGRPLGESAALSIPYPTLSKSSFDCQMLIC
jgi:hypothetical protein